MHCLREEFRAAKGQFYVESDSLSKLRELYFREIKRFFELSHILRLLGSELWGLS